jgi:hypothetical protein
MYYGTHYDLRVMDSHNFPRATRTRVNLVASLPLSPVPQIDLQNVLPFCLLPFVKHLSIRTHYFSTD